MTFFSILFAVNSFDVNENILYGGQIEWRIKPTSGSGSESKAYVTGSKKIPVLPEKLIL